jgi:membrane protease subunit HflK
MMDLISNADLSTIVESFAFAGGPMDQFRPRNEQYTREIQRGMEDVKDFMEKMFKGRGFWIALVVLVLLYFATGTYVVGPGEKGVVLLFGRSVAQTDPGLRYHAPWPFMSHFVVDVAKVRRAEIGFRSEGGRSRSVPAESLMLTGDENIVDVELLVQYQVQDPMKFLFGARNPERALRASAEVALRGVVGENTIDYTMTKGRLEVQQQVQKYLQGLLDDYNTGLLVTQTRLLEVDPPNQVQEAFHDVVRAWEDRERLIREAEGYREDILPKARGEAQQEILGAEAYKARRVIRAKGDAQRFENVLTEYTKAPDITRERLYLEAVQTFLPSARKFVMGGRNSQALPILPLTGMMGEGAQKSSRPPSGTASEPRKKGN